MKTGPYGEQGVWSNGGFCQRYRDRRKQRQRKTCLVKSNNKEGLQHMASHVIAQSLDDLICLGLYK